MLCLSQLMNNDPSVRKFSISPNRHAKQCSQTAKHGDMNNGGTKKSRLSNSVNF